MAFVPRTSAPSATDPRYVNVHRGGYNNCIVIDSSNGCTMPNCTGYVHGRVMEMNDLYFDTDLSTLNAKYYYANTADGFSRGSEPQLGAVICFDETNGAGHVAIVEQIVDSDTIITSDSNYGAEFWVQRTRRRSLGWNWYSGSPLSFQGFIYTYTESPTPPTPVDPTEEELLLMFAAKRRRKGDDWYS